MADDEIAEDPPEPVKRGPGRPRRTMPESVEDIAVAGAGEVRVEIIRDGGSGAVHDGHGNKYERGDRIAVAADVAASWVAQGWAEKI